MTSARFGTWLVGIGILFVGVAALGALAPAIQRARGVSLSVDVTSPLRLTLIGAALCVAGWWLRQRQRA